MCFDSHIKLKRKFLGVEYTISDVSNRGTLANPHTTVNLKLTSSALRLRRLNAGNGHFPPSTSYDEPASAECTTLCKLRQAAEVRSKHAPAAAPTASTAPSGPAGAEASWLSRSCSKPCQVPASWATGLNVNTGAKCDTAVHRFYHCASECNWFLQVMRQPSSQCSYRSQSMRPTTQGFIRNRCCRPCGAACTVQSAFTPLACTHTSTFAVWDASLCSSVRMLVRCDTSGREKPIVTPCECARLLSCTIAMQGGRMRARAKCSAPPPLRSQPQSMPAGAWAGTLVWMLWLRPPFKRLTVGKLL